MSAARGFRLDEAVTDMYSDMRVTPMLRRLIGHSRDLLGAVAGSVSFVDPVKGRYEKMAESGVACKLGQSFPLDEGATGKAFASRRPIVIDDYSRLGQGHLPAGHPANRGAAAAAPLWWRDEVIGVNVAFAGESRRFSTTQMDAFEALTQSVAAAVVQAGATVPSLAGLLRDHGRVLAAGSGVETIVTEAGQAKPVPDGVAATAVDIVSTVHDSAARNAGSLLRVAVMHGDGELRLLVQNEPGMPNTGLDDPLGLGASTWRDLVTRADRQAAGALDVEHVAGWGTLVRAAFPTFPDAPPPAADQPERRQDEADPLTGRERQVLELIATGLSDREVARRLVISPKTVGKHVGAVLRKTTTHTRTAAVVRAAELGWVHL